MPTLANRSQKGNPQPMTETISFRDVMTTILQRITEGPWGPGTLLPGEIELAEDFGVSRTTMNRALREIEALGLLDRRRKAGTRVRMAPLRQARFEMPMVRAEIEKTGAIYGYRLIARQVGVASQDLCHRMSLAPGAQVLHVICLHSANGTPFQFEDRWINCAALPDVQDQDFAQSGPNEWLVATVPFSQVEVSFGAVAADDLVSRHLGLAAGVPVFCIDRATWWQEAAITQVTLYHQPGYRVTTRY